MTDMTNDTAALAIGGAAIGNAIAVAIVNRRNPFRNCIKSPLQALCFTCGHEFVIPGEGSVFTAPFWVVRGPKGNVSGVGWGLELRAVH